MTEAQPKGGHRKEIVVISGKGGTGKTSVTAAFAALAEDAVLADCDVDAADLAIILDPVVREEGDFSGGKQATIVAERCVGCGRCFELCEFGAIDRNLDLRDTVYTVDPVACEGCGVCAHFCPQGAVDFREVVNGRWFLSDTRFGPMAYAELGIAEENSGKLVSLVREKARQEAADRCRSIVLIDGPPGVGCPVISSVTGVDLVVIVSEPTLSGLHDTERVMELARHFDVPVLVCVNKADINPEIAGRIEDIAGEERTLGRIPYDISVVEAQVARKTVIEYSRGPAAMAIELVWKKIESYIADTQQ
jgi:MinD superfamily P-loop ATPase